MITILWEDAHVLFCLKERGVCSESTPQRDGLPDLLAAQIGAPLFCVHRLDQPVGGVMMFAKDAKTAARLTAAMQTQEIEKTYLAVVAGKTEAQDTLHDLLFHDRQRNRTYPVTRMRRGVREAILSYRTLAYDARIDHSLVKIQLQTGRTHQIRAQLAAHGHPLFGDGRYGSRQKGEIALFCTCLAVAPSVLGSALQVQMPPVIAPWTQFEIKKEESEL